MDFSAYDMAFGRFEGRPRSNIYIMRELCLISHFAEFFAVGTFVWRSFISILVPKKIDTFFYHRQFYMQKAKEPNKALCFTCLLRQTQKKTHFDKNANSGDKKTISKSIVLQFHYGWIVYFRRLPVANGSIKPKN